MKPVSKKVTSVGPTVPKRIVPLFLFSPVMLFTVFVFLVMLSGCGQTERDGPQNGGQVKVKQIQNANQAAKVNDLPPSKPSYSARAAAFSEQGDRLLVAMHKTHAGGMPGWKAPKTILAFYEVPSGKVLWSIEAVGALYPIAIFPGGKKALVADEKSLQVWDLKQGNWAKVVVQQEERLFATANLKKNLATTTSPKGVLSIWDTRTWKKLQELSLGAPLSPLLSPDGGLVVCNFWSTNKARNTVEVWDWKEKKLMFSNPKSKGWLGWPASFSPGGQWIASSLSALSEPKPGEFVDETFVVLWDPNTGKIHKKLKMAASTIGFAENGRHLILGTLQALKAVDLERESLIWETTMKPAAHTIVFSPDGKLGFAASGSSPSADGMKLRLWDLKTGTPIRLLRPVY